MISFLLFTLSGCPAKLDVSDADSANKHSEIPVVPPTLGINLSDDCDQKQLGSSVCNLFLLDQNDNYWELYENKGKVIVLDFSTVWCYPCQLAANSVQTVQDAYGDKIIFVTLLVEGMTGFPATKEDVTQWATDHNITTAPVLQASRDYVVDPAGITGYLVGGWPTYVYLDQDLKIANAHVGFNEEYVRNILDTMVQ